VTVDIEAVGIFVPNEIAKGALFDSARPSVGFNHEHLVGVDGIDVVIMDMMDV
jgi:hypothetical protein